MMAPTPRVRYNCVVDEQAARGGVRDGAYLLAETQRAIARQEANLDSLRDRAGRLVTVSSVVAALFAVATQDVSWWQSITKVFALSGACMTIVLVVFIEWPRSWAFERTLLPIIKEYRSGESRYAPGDGELALAQGLAESHDKNAARLGPPMAVYTSALFVVVFQLAMWILTAL